MEIEEEASSDQKEQQKENIPEPPKPCPNTFFNSFIYEKVLKRKSSDDSIFSLKLSKKKVKLEKTPEVQMLTPPEKEKDEEVELIARQNPNIMQFNHAWIIANSGWMDLRPRTAKELLKGSFSRNSFPTFTGAPSHRATKFSWSSFF